MLEFLEILLGSSTATLTLGNDLDSALFGGRGQVHLQDLGADRTRKLQERERCTGLDDNGLKAVLEHVRGHQLELLGCNELDDLAEATLLGQRLSVVSQFVTAIDLNLLTLP